MPILTENNGKIKIFNTPRNLNYGCAIAITFVCCIILIIIQPFFFPALVLPALIISYRRGIEFNLYNRTYRKFSQAFFENFGPVKSLKGYTHIGLRPVKLAYRQYLPVAPIFTGSLSYTESTLEVEIYLWGNNQEKLALATAQMRKLYPVACRLASRFDLELYIHERLNTEDKRR